MSTKSQKKSSKKQNPINLHQRKDNNQNIKNLTLNQNPTFKNKFNRNPVSKNRFKRFKKCKIKLRNKLFQNLSHKKSRINKERKSLKLMILNRLTVHLKSKFQWKRWFLKTKIPKLYNLLKEECYLLHFVIKTKNLPFLTNYIQLSVLSSNNSNRNGFRLQKRSLKNTKKFIK